MCERQTFYQVSYSLSPQSLAFVRQEKPRPYWKRKYIKAGKGCPPNIGRGSGLESYCLSTRKPEQMSQALKPLSFIHNGNMLQ